MFVVYFKKKSCSLSNEAFCKENFSASIAQFVEMHELQCLLKGQEKFPAFLHGFPGKKTEKLGCFMRQYTLPGCIHIKKTVYGFTCYAYPHILWDTAPMWQYNLYSVIQPSCLLIMSYCKVKLRYRPVSFGGFAIIPTEQIAFCSMSYTYSFLAWCTLYRCHVSFCCFKECLWS